MRTIVCCLFLLTLAGCNGGSTVVIPDNPIDERIKKTVDIDRRLLTECDDLVVITQPTLKPEDLFDYRAADLLIHKKCKQNNHSLIEIIRKAFNIQP
jgi:hypothetical protein